MVDEPRRRPTPLGPQALTTDEDVARIERHAINDECSALPVVEAFYGERGLPATVQVSPAARHGLVRVDDLGRCACHEWFGG